MFILVTDPCDDSIMSISWEGSGGLLATTARDNNLTVYDPRSSSVVLCKKCHDNCRDSRTVWLGDSKYIVTTGFSKVSNH